MNLGIRAILYSARKWKKTLLVFCLLLAITTLVLSGLAIADARRNRLRKSGEPPGPALPWRETYLLAVGPAAIVVLIVRRNLYPKKCFRKFPQ